MTLVGFRAQNHRQQVGRRGARPEVDNLATTLEVFGPLHERFAFTIDVAALPHNAKLPRYFTPSRTAWRRAGPASAFGATRRTATSTPGSRRHGTKPRKRT